jgi:FixJ family two-component response regulator
VNVIVVARFLDIQLYFETMEQGACDFVMPPFRAPEIHHVVVCALEEVQGRWSGHAQSDGDLQSRNLPKQTRASGQVGGAFIAAPRQQKGQM